MDTTVMVDVAITLRIAWATCGSCRDGNKTLGIQALISGAASSAAERIAPAAPRTIAMSRGRIRKPPRSAYIPDRINVGSRRCIIRVLDLDRSSFGSPINSGPTTCGDHRSNYVGIGTGALAVPVFADGPDAAGTNARSPHARYALLSRNNGRWSVEMFSLAYDWERAARRALENTLEHQFWRISFLAVEGTAPACFHLA